MVRKMLCGVAIPMGILVAMIGATGTVWAEDSVHKVASGCHQGWYTNPDEGDRVPEQAEAGFLFQPADLVHHAAGFPVEDLSDGGTFVTDPAPGENFRFSVEVGNEDYSGYATLHWNGSAWFVGGVPDLGTQTDPSSFMGQEGNFGPIGDTVLSFGVGYTLNPPGEVTTTVSLISFRGETYDLACRKKGASNTPTPSPGTTASPTASPTPQVTGSSNPSVTGQVTEAPAAQLPVTGSGVGRLAIAGGVALGIGVVILFGSMIGRTNKQ